MSTENSLRVAIALLSLILCSSAGPAFAGNIVRFDATYAEPAPPADSPRACWRWSRGAGDWTWACRIGAYKRAYPVNPMQSPAPMRYDYADYGTPVPGSSLSQLVQRPVRDPGFVPHAD